MREPIPSFPLQILPILTAQKSCDLLSEPSLMAPQESSLLESLLPHLPEGSISLFALVSHSSYHTSQHSVIYGLSLLGVNSCLNARILSCSSC